MRRHSAKPAWQGRFERQRQQRVEAAAAFCADALTSTWRDAVQAFAAELAASLPLPWDAKVTATARGMQITGILLCVTNGRDLTTCYCFTDLALTEGSQGGSQESTHSRPQRLDGTRLITALRGQGPVRDLLRRFKASIVCPLAQQSGCHTDV
jgi:hypothetical protein